VLERFLRRNRQYATTTTQSRPLTPKPLRGMASLGATSLCAAVFLFAFLIPVMQLIVWSTWTYQKVWRSDFAEILMNTMTGAALGTAIIIVLALLSARTTTRLLSSSSVAYSISRLLTA